MSDYVIITVTVDGRRRQGRIFSPNDDLARKAFATTWDGAPDAVQGTLLHVRGKAMRILAGGWRGELATSTGAGAGSTR